MTYATIKIEYVKQAITCLQNMSQDLGKSANYTPIAALRQALESPLPDPVAWRTFDGEGGYEYRNYEDNQDYDEWWNRRNPNHLNWVEPLYTLPHLALTIDRYVWEETDRVNNDASVWHERTSKIDPRLPENKKHNPDTNWNNTEQVRNFRVLYTIPAPTPKPENKQTIREEQEAPFEAWWESEGQFGRAGGGQYEKTFAWNAWCAALSNQP